MAAKRDRQLSNPNVRESDYIQALKEYMGKRPLQEVLGPLCGDGGHGAMVLQKVMPVHVVRSAKLLESLIFLGCKNAVICSSRFEMAVKAVLSDGNDLLAAQITDHVRLCFATVRQMKLDIESGQVGVRCRKSSAFRRACSASETIVIEAIVSKIELIKKSSMAPAGNTPTKPEKPTDALQDLNLDKVDDVRKLFRLGQDCLNGLEAEMDSMTGPVIEDIQPEKDLQCDTPKSYVN